MDMYDERNQTNVTVRIRLVNEPVRRKIVYRISWLNVLVVTKETAPYTVADITIV